MGMSAAIGELRSQRDRKSTFDEVQFPGNGSNDESVISLETQALQTVYHFLSDCSRSPALNKRLVWRKPQCIPSH
jgi:hypothetical protein